MFKGTTSLSFKSTKAKSEVLKVVEEQLENLGMVSISETGGITISSGRFDGTGYKTSIVGRVSDRDGKFTVTLDFEAKPDTMGWVIAICFFPIGLAVFILPNNAKGDIQRRADQAISEIRAVLDER
jgi:hypothetical protein